MRKPMAFLSPASIQLSNQMRQYWFEHVLWTRLLIISIVDSLPDTDAVIRRILQNPNDLASLFAPYYDNEVAHTISRLLTEHLDIGADLIKALKAQDDVKAKQLDAQWHQNADQMAKAFAALNPHTDEQMLRQMLYHHLALTSQEVNMRMASNYIADIATFDQVEQQALDMADTFTNGIIQQFPNRF